MNKKMAALIGILLPAISVAACDDTAPAPEAESTSTSTPTTTTTIAAPEPTQPGVLDAELANRILRSTWSSLADPTAEIDLSQILTETALEDIENQRLEWATNEFRQEGNANIVGTTVEPGETPDTAIARVCIDSTRVEVLDENGSTVNDDIPREEQRSLMIAVFSLDDGVWKLAEQQFPDDPRC
ncbi:hypothetical protein CMUST_02380 [Corynebacterium mustelae]|uniref:Uncharacterized protein n=1 Tax=Corynebacterium mustelae TaxID=571915 RepID=A0A0G3GWB6_9CORY|nr:hypothetical protein [Corynebacterium mustelae]AKK04820.1 hypothetical protein CMUST_02380 [Corynebacterium mustelae]